MQSLRSRFFTKTTAGSGCRHLPVLPVTAHLLVHRLVA